ncbi:Hypothetical predicted protein [Octopus vulgaris]|uniref:Uncharacterized protein n=1 Tax=Octopus vulgaris TaxID=6645 RepID=A0AA36BNU1_OCTVU|nr:Hypothetical predicted protein [Octopus vulgaris]
MFGDSKQKENFDNKNWLLITHDHSKSYDHMINQILQKLSAKEWKNITILVQVDIVNVVIVVAVVVVHHGIHIVMFKLRYRCEAS